MINPKYTINTWNAALTHPKNLNSLQSSSFGAVVRCCIMAQKCAVVLNLIKLRRVLLWGFSIETLQTLKMNLMAKTKSSVKICKFMSSRKTDRSQLLLLNFFFLFLFYSRHTEENIFFTVINYVQLNSRCWCRFSFFCLHSRPYPTLLPSLSVAKYLQSNNKFYNM